MADERFSEIFKPEILKELFPEDRADAFFEALFGDSSEGAYDIGLGFRGHREDRLEFELHLTERPGKCLTCSLTYGLPNVFRRHPVINIGGLVEDIDRLLDGRAKCLDWRLEPTREVSNDRHVVPLTVFLGKTKGEGE